MAERATSVTPTARVTISTLLPRRDVPPHEINKINAEISKACTGIPNVHMAHHAEILYQHLYDNLHLNQSGVRLFIKDIKDTALDRNRSTPHITNKSTSNHRNLHRKLQHNRDTNNNGRSFSKRLGPASRYYAPAATLQGPSPISSGLQPHFTILHTPPLPPLQGPSPITPTSTQTPQDHNPYAPHYTSALRDLSCSLFYILKLSRNNTVGSSSSQLRLRSSLQLKETATLL